MFSLKKKPPTHTKLPEEAAIDFINASTDDTCKIAFYYKDFNRYLDTLKYGIVIPLNCNLACSFERGGVVLIELLNKWFDKRRFSPIERLNFIELLKDNKELYHKAFNALLIANYNFNHTTKTEFYEESSVVTFLLHPLMYKKQNLYAYFNQYGDSLDVSVLEKVLKLSSNPDMIAEVIYNKLLSKKELVNMVKRKKLTLLIINYYLQNHKFKLDDLSAIMKIVKKCTHSHIYYNGEEQC